MENEMAVIMAAGFGKRMMPLTEHRPKPLIRVFNRPMIETVIEALERRGVSSIYIVTGYLGEMFSYLETKYDNITLVKNAEYNKKNNISSIYAVSDLLGTKNCFICEADLYLSDPHLFQQEITSSCYFGKMKKGYSDDWVFDLSEDGRITRVGKGGVDTYNMVGVSYFYQKDAAILSEAIRESYKKKGHEQLYWDDVVNENLDRLVLKVHPVADGQIVELDTEEELAAFDKDYREYNEGGKSEEVY